MNAFVSLPFYVPLGMFIILGVLCLLPSRKRQSSAGTKAPAPAAEVSQPVATPVAEGAIPALPYNASGDQMNEYLVRYPQQKGMTLVYKAETKVYTNPDDRTETTLKVVVGEVVNFGVKEGKPEDQEHFCFGDFKETRKNRYDAARLKALQGPRTAF